MTSPTPKGEEMTAEERAKRICDDLEGRKMGKRQIAIWVCRLTQEIKAAEVAAYDEAVEASLKVVSCDDCYAKGFAEAIALAVKMVKSIEPLRDSQPGIGLHDEVFRQIIASNVGTIRPSGSDELK